MQADLELSQLFFGTEPLWHLSSEEIHFRLRNAPFSMKKPHNLKKIENLYYFEVTLNFIDFTVLLIFQYTRVLLNSNPFVAYSIRQ